MNEISFRELSKWREVGRAAKIERIERSKGGNGAESLFDSSMVPSMTPSLTDAVSEFLSSPSLEERSWSDSPAAGTMRSDVVL